MKKKIFQMICIGLLVVITSAATAFGMLMLIRNKNSAETGNVLGVSWYNETDTEFTIKTPKQLNEFAGLSQFYTFEGQTVKLGADIILNEGAATTWEENAPENKWKPIQGFAGTFDGQNHTISGLYGKAHQSKYALFTDAVLSCEIKNFKLTNSYMETSGSRGVASIVSGGGCKIIGVYSDAIINHRGEYVAGIASLLAKQSTLEECCYDGTISTTGPTCGGIVDQIGEARVTFRHCLFSGTINQSYAVDTVSTMQAKTGGLVGMLQKQGAMVVMDCLVTGKVNSENALYTGGLAGATSTGSQTMIRDTYVSEETYATVIGTQVGVHDGVAAKISADKLQGVKSYQWTTLDFAKYWSVMEDDEPVLKRFGGDGVSVAGVEKEYDTSWYNSGGYNFEISNAKQLYGLFYVACHEKFVGKTVTLAADITLNEGSAKEWAKMPPQYEWTAIENFGGVFDGQGHTISGLYMDTKTQFQGMFGKTVDNVLIKNFRLENSYFNNSSTGTNVFASVVGELRGNIENVYSNAIVVSHGNQAGGIVGRVSDSDSSGVEDAIQVTNCWFDGELHMKGENTMYGGGVVGWQVQGDVEIAHCLNTGIVSSEKPKGAVQVGGIIGLTGGATARITDCLNVGMLDVKYGACVGSIIGRARGEEQKVYLENVYATEESYKKTIGTSSTAIISGGVVQLDDSWLKGENAYKYTDLDFAKYWAMVKEDTPVLQQFAKNIPSTSSIKKVVDTTWYKEGQKEFVIDSMNDLYGLALLSRAVDFTNKTVKLGADINVNEVKDGKVVPNHMWLLIGPSYAPFEGVFDGQGHVISGVYLDTVESYSGLFGKIGEHGSIKNFKLKDSYFLNTGTSSNVIGSVAGELAGTMENVYSNATVISHGNMAGGLLGRTNDIDEEGTEDKDKVVINNCWFDGTFIFKGTDVRYGGGITGLSNRGDLDIINCLNTGLISDQTTGKTYHIGGIIGTNSLTGKLYIKDCMNTGMIDSDYAACVGGIIGQVRKTEEGVHIRNTYATKESHDYTVGNTSVKSSLYGGVIHLEEEKFIGQRGYQFTELDFGTHWGIRENGTPVLKTFYANVSQVTSTRLVNTSWYNSSAKQLEIDSKDKFLGLALKSFEEDFKGQKIVLSADMALDSNVEWIPIGSAEKPFAGEFDGQNHKISNMVIQSENGKSAMFGAIAAKGIARNFSLLNSTFDYVGEATASSIVYVASVCAELSGQIKNIYSDATVTSTGSRVGGLVAGVPTSAKATIEECWFAGKLSMKGQHARYAGGILGTTMGSSVEMINCLNTGDVSCESTSANFIGGILGADIAKCEVLIKNCLSTGYVTSNHSTYSGAGSVIGIAYTKGSAYTLENVYALKTACVTPANAIKTSTWFADVQKKGDIKTLSIDRLVGTQGFYNTRLDFDTDGPWVARKKTTENPNKNSVPALKNFADASVCESVAGLTRPEVTENIVVDTSWFDKEKFEAATDKTYTLVNENQMMGLAKIVNDGTFDFEGWHIIVGRNMDFDGTSWTPIGTGSNPFKGRFDGDDNTISGLKYEVKNAASNTTVNAGLFGCVAKPSVIENLRLTDSTFKVFNGVAMGSVVGRSDGGTIQNVYSSATVIADANSNSIGQFIGYVTNDITLKNCWSAGELRTIKTAGNGPTYVGGFIGYVRAASKVITVTNCMRTGNITNERTANYPRVGGFCGLNDQASTVYNFTNYIEAGKITVASAKMVGLLFGQLAGMNTKAKFKDCYITGTLADGTKEYPYVIQWSAATTVLENVPTQTTAEKLSEKTIEQLFSTQSEAWVKVAGKIPFVLKSFSDMVQ